jgi:hypothetical protein
MGDYLRFNAQVDPLKEDFIATLNSRSQAVTIFAINKNLRYWLEKLYVNNTPIYTHQSATLIEGIMKFSEGRNDQPLYIYVDRFKLHLLACKEGKLLYYNQFAIKQFSDYVRYIMMVMKSLNMDQRTSQVVLWGYIGKNSPHYHEFYKYVNNVIFGSRPDFLEYGYVFDEIQDHHFLDLYSVHLME